MYIEYAQKESIYMFRWTAFVPVVLIASTASAQIEFIAQRFVLNEPLIAPLAAVDFFAQVDLSTITGVGMESAVITVSSIRLLERADVSSPFVIIAAGEVDTPGDPYSDDPLQLRAGFMDGVFTDDVWVVEDPNTGTLELLQVTNSSGFAGFFTVDGFDAIYGPTILSLRSYRRESSSITPTPGTLTLLAVAGVLGCRRRRTCS